MSLLTICQGAARGVTAIPPTIINRDDDTARTLLQCAQDEGEALARRAHPLGAWVALTKEHTFTTTADTAEYDLPADFARLIDGTIWDRAQYMEMRGPLTPWEWQEVKSSVLGSSVAVTRRYRIRNVGASSTTPGTVKFTIDPTPSASGEALVFEYASKHWCKSAAGAGQTEWAADSDLGVLDEYLVRLGVKWRLLRALGMAYGEERDEYDRECDQAIARDGGGRGTLSIAGGRRRFRPIGAGNVPDTGFGQ